MSEWVASQYLDDARWGILDSDNHIIIGVSKELTQEQVEAVVLAHNQDMSAGGK